MKRIMLLTFILTMLCISSAYAQKIEEPDKKYTDDDIAQRLYEGEAVPFTDIFYAEGSEMPMAIALEDISSINFYDQLSVYEQQVYDNLAANIDKCINGTENIVTTVNIPATNVTSDNYKQKIEEASGVPYDYFLTRPLYAYLYLDHPEKFWMDLNRTSIKLNISATSNTMILKITVTVREKDKNGNPITQYWPACYTSQAQVEADISAIESKINEIISGLPESASDFCKTKYFTEWLCNNNTYNPYIAHKENYGNEFIESLRYPYIAPSAFLYGKDTSEKADEKYPVCEGYSEAFKILCNRTGVESMCMESKGHKWNAVKIGNKFYYSDPTWCDTTGFKDPLQYYSYLLIGTEKMKALDSSTNHNISFQTLFEAPPIAQKMYIEDMGLPVYNTRYYYYKYLDTDNSGVIDIADIRKLLRQAAGIETKNMQNDMNSDNKIDLTDCIKLIGLMF